jgi:hypothetical protein
MGLLQFSVRRLLWNQSVISVMTELILFLNSSGFVFDTRKSEFYIWKVVKSMHSLIKLCAHTVHSSLLKVVQQDAC